MNIITVFYPRKACARGPREKKSNLRRELESSYFSLRLYWEKGYRLVRVSHGSDHDSCIPHSVCIIFPDTLRWQGKTEEKLWCIQCTQSNCSKGSGIRVDKCDKGDSRQQFYYDDGRIRSRKNHSLCFERKGRSIELDSCNKSIYQKVQ